MLLLCILFAYLKLGGSIALIYASHLLEHFGRYQYKDVLKEWFRVLQPGGVLSPCCA